MSENIKNQRLIVHRSAVPRREQSFARTVVCELRFPLLMELGIGKPPPQFVSVIRKHYPQLERVEEIAVGPSGPGTTTAAHIFRSLKGGWALSLKQSSVLLESTAYPGYEKFRERVIELVAAAGPIIDSDFWTRVGLRYINDIPLVDTRGPSDVASQLNPSLVAPLTSGVFQGVADFSGKIQGEEDGKGYQLQHGLRLEKSSRGTIERTYRVDVDIYRPEIPVSETMSVLDEMHAEAFDIFDWTLTTSSTST